MTPSEVRQAIEGVIEEQEKKVLEHRVTISLNRKFWDRIERDSQSKEQSGNYYGFDGKARQEARNARKQAGLNVWVLQNGIQSIREDFATELAYEAPEEDKEGTDDSLPTEPGTGSE